jgi:hypothetical protein
MGRIWRSEAGIVLLAYFIACLAALGCAALGHPGPRAYRPSADALAARAIPRLWMVLTALLAGLVVTLLFLASMDWGALPGCGPAGAVLAQLPGRCFGLQEGLPLRFLSAYQGVPEISKRALAEDWAQWSLVSFSLLYLSRLQVSRLDYTPAATEQPSAV